MMSDGPITTEAANEILEVLGLDLRAYPFSDTSVVTEAILMAMLAKIQRLEAHIKNTRRAKAGTIIVGPNGEAYKVAHDISIDDVVTIDAILPVTGTNKPSEIKAGDCVPRWVHDAIAALIFTDLEPSK